MHGLAQFFARAGMVPVDEVSSRHSLLAFQLKVEQFQRGVFAATCNQPVILDCKLPFHKIFLDWPRSPEVQVLASEAGECAGPRLESSQPIAYLPGRQLKIDSAVLF